MKTIAFIDLSLAGHHLSFMRSFTRILLQQGNQVICAVPGVSKVAEWIDKTEPQKAHLFTGLEYDYELEGSKKTGRFHNPLNVIKRWRYDARLLKSVEASRSVKIDLVFYAWMDTHLSQYVHPFILDTIFPYKWSGLYFHPYHLRLEQNFLKRKASWRDHDGVFLSKNCIAVTVHDQGIVEDFSKRICKPVIHFPETADDTAPDLTYPLYREIKQKAKGRIVVGMIGCEPNKGTLTLMHLAKKADKEVYFFCFIGLLPIHSFNAEEKTALEAFVAEQSENCFFHFHPIPEGGAYNAVFSCFDIPFLVYDNFISSSNRLTKAAIFHKLVLASNNFCVGEDVKKYNLGKGIPPKDAEAALKGLKELAVQLKTGKFPLEDWKEYRRINSNQMLHQRFAEVTSLLK